jgi:hypothetical protein
VIQHEIGEILTDSWKMVEPPTAKLEWSRESSQAHPALDGSFRNLERVS